MSSGSISFDYGSFELTQERHYTVRLGLTTTTPHDPTLSRCKSSLSPHLSRKHAGLCLRLQQ